MNASKQPLLEIGPHHLTVEQLLDIARGRVRVVLDPNPEFRATLAKGRDALGALLSSGKTVYGVTTGVGDSCTNDIAEELAHILPRNLARFHGVGTGRMLDEIESAAVLATRVCSLSKGWSAVRPELLEQLCALLNHRILPRIPAEGSVGASGDLTPLSYIASVVMGEREVLYEGEERSAADALEAAGLEPMSLELKESLAIMNGTSVMTALGCLAFRGALRLSRLAAAQTAMASDVMRGNKAHFDDRIFQAKPHPGQRRCAAWIRQDIGADPLSAGEHTGRLQDRYSIRCAPHVIGVLVDALPWIRDILETELNGANDNPLVDPETGDVLHGGNFYGGHLCFAMDALKTAVANIADLQDRQMALLCDAATNNGLPANLVAREGDDRHTHHGFKAMQIAASALAAEALKLTMPASVFSRSTECHNQDKVSMGTIAARDCLRVIALSEQVSAITLLALCQAVDLRKSQGCGPRAQALHAAVREKVAMNTEDRRMDVDIQTVLDLHRRGKLPMGELNMEGPF